jgi:hypothetical protein
VNKEIADRIDRALWRAFAGKLGGSYPHSLAFQIKWLDGLAGNEKEEAVAWLSRTLLKLARTDRRTLRQVLDALDTMRKTGDVFNRKRHRMLVKYAGLNYRLKRPPTLEELNPANKNVGRGYRKMLKADHLPITNVPRGHRPKGAKDAFTLLGIKRPSKAA